MKNNLKYILISGLIIMTALPVFNRSIDGTSDKKTALLLIDIQDFYFPGGGVPLYQPEKASASAKKILTHFRAAGQLVVHVKHRAKNGASIHKDVLPFRGEKVIEKTDVNSFKNTDLLEYLKKNQITDLVICGMQTHMCLEGGTRAAADFGFKCTVIGDACATRDLKWNDQTVKAADVSASTFATLKAYAKITDTRAFLKNK